MTLVTAAELREVFDYDPELGRLFRPNKNGEKPKPRREVSAKKRPTIFINGKVYLEHRAIWLWHHGKWPTNDIDHIDRNPKNNKIENLRDVTTSENGQNRTIPKNNTTGYKGVTRAEKGSRFIASITHHGKRIVIGSFLTPEAAANAYMDSAANLHKYNPSANAERLAVPTEPKYKQRVPSSTASQSGRPPLEATLQAVSFMIKNPNARITHVARDFGVHRVTLSTAMAKVKKFYPICASCGQEIKNQG
jgi:hypothetical protein